VSEQVYTVELQVEVKAETAIEARALVQDGLPVELEARVSAVFDELGERVG
jgi:hypothetical protein